MTTISRSRIHVSDLAYIAVFAALIIVLAFVVAAVLTPPDVVSQLALAVPMCLLYELGLMVAPMFARATRAPEETA